MRMLERDLADRLAADYPCQLARARILVKRRDGCKGTVVTRRLCNQQMCLRKRRHLSQMRHNDHLPLHSNLRELLPDLLRRASGDTRVNLVENKRSHSVTVSEHVFN